MSDETSAPAGGEAIAVITPASDAPETFSVSQAAEALTEARKPKRTAESADDPATADPELAQANDEPDENPPLIEDADAAEPEETLPPLEPPRSWTKAEKERFQSLPRETQEYLHTREQERDREVRRSQNEVAEQRKAIEVERQKAEQLRQQYEANLPALMQELQNAQNGSFSDVKTVDDVTKLANEDPFRYLQWQAHQTKLQAVNAEAQRARETQTQAEQAAWAQHVQKENELASDYIPELADKTKAADLTNKVVAQLHELGFKDSELGDLANGKSKLSIFDHRLQRLFYNNLKFTEAKSAIKPAPQSLPPVQRPGTSKPAGHSTSQEIQSLEKQLTQTGDMKIAQRLRALQSSQRRAS